MPVEFQVNPELNDGDEYIRHLQPILSFSQPHVYSFVEDANLLLVYRQFCVQENAVDPPIREFWFLKHIEPLGLGFLKVHAPSLEGVGQSRPGWSTTGTLRPPN